MKYIVTPKGYFYKISSKGKKTRISSEEYRKKGNKSKRQKGGQRDLRKPKAREVFGDNARTLHAIGDGSCFIHSFLDLTDSSYRNKSSREQQRQADEMRDTWNLQLDDYIRDKRVSNTVAKTLRSEMGTCRAWISNDTWVYISWITDKNIFVYDNSNDTLQCFDVEFNTRNPSFFIAFVNNNHYEPILINGRRRHSFEDTVVQSAVVECNLLGGGNRRSKK